MADRRKGERRKGGSPGGLRLSAEDVQWLRLIDLKSSEAVPAFNKSRLIALGLVESVDGELRLTERGRKSL